MRVLALNCGSSSLKTAVVDTTSGARLLDVCVEGIGGSSPALTIDGRESAVDTNTDIAMAVETVLRELSGRLCGNEALGCVAHRIAHGGERFITPIVVDDAVLGELDRLGRLAPMHNPPAIDALRKARLEFASIPQVAVFDTSFHATLPRRAREYALPAELRDRLGLRRYGFHGISHAHVAQQVAGFLGVPAHALRIVSCHLGNGASVAAIEYGRSVETSMGMTPLEGLVMGTRPGDLDPGILLELMRELDRDELERILNRRSGLAGLTGTQDMRAIEQRAADGDDACQLALTVYGHRVRKYIGAYAATMGGVDVIAFTGGVGEHSALIRHRSLQRLGFLGAQLDEDRNRVARVSFDEPCVGISAEVSSTKLCVVRADEEACMARQAATLIDSGNRGRPLRIPVAVSARHAHLSQCTLDRLFGADYRLHRRADLSQPGQFSAEETITLRGPRGELRNVRLMGPPRDRDQVEVSRSDEFVLGVDAPVRVSGDLANTPGITVVGPAGELSLPSGLICARRHIHMPPEDARRLGVADCESISVRLDTDGRDLRFDDVTVRVSPDFSPELHLDTDEANAAGVKPGDQAELLGPGQTHSRISGRSSP